MAGQVADSPKQSSMGWIPASKLTFTDEVLEADVDCKLPETTNNCVILSGQLCDGIKMIKFPSNYSKVVTGLLLIIFRSPTQQALEE